MSTIDFHSLAKTELHCHLDGSLSLPTIRQLAAMANIDLPASDEELRHHVTAPAHCENLLDYLEAFDYIRPLLQTKEALTLAAYDVAKQAALENVVYIEVRFAPELSMDHKGSPSQKLSMLSVMVYAKPRRNLALLQKPWSVACASPIKKSPLAFLQKPTKLVIRILLVLTLPGMSTTTLQKIFDL